MASIAAQTTPTTTPPPPSAGRSGRSRVTVVAPGDRTAAFRAARRHTILVKTLKLCLPLAAIGVLSSYWLDASVSFSFQAGPVSIPRVQLSSEHLTMERPRYEGFEKDGSRYVVTAAKAIQDLRQQGPIKLETIDGTLFRQGQGPIVVKSPRGTFDNKTNVLELMERVDIDGEDGLKARLTQATVLLKEHKVISRQPVMLEMAAGRVTGNQMVFLKDKRQATFTGAVETQLKPQSKAEPVATPQKRSTGPLGQRTLGAGNAPVDVSSDRLFVDDNRKAAVFTGNVKARQGEAHLSSGELEAHYEGQPVSLGAPASPQAIPSGADSTGGKLKRLIARENVVIKQGADRVTSAVGEFDAVNETAVLTGGVVITSAPDRRAQSDRAEFNQRADTVLLTGNVDVAQGNTILRGRRLYVDRKRGKLKLSSPAEDGQPAGRIFTRFVQAAQPAAKKKGAGLAKPQDAPTSPLLFNPDPTQPTDIEAATLDADDTAKTAIYRGRVRAQQGASTIETEELIAYYTGSAAAGLAADQSVSGSPDTKSKTELTRIVSHSKLTVTSANDQSATGDQGEFDIKANRIVVTGNVTLRQGKNISHGPKAIIDLATGHYQMEGANPTPWRSTTAPGSGSGVLPDNTIEQQTPSPRVTDPERQCPPGRSCAVFHPNDAKSFERKKETSGAAPSSPSRQEPRLPAPTGGATSSWDTTTSQSRRQ